MCVKDFEIHPKKRDPENKKQKCKVHDTYEQEAKGVGKVWNTRVVKEIGG